MQAGQLKQKSERLKPVKYQCFSLPTSYLYTPYLSTPRTVNILRQKPRTQILQKAVKHCFSSCWPPCQAPHTTEHFSLAPLVSFLTPRRNPVKNGSLWKFQSLPEIMPSLWLPNRPPGHVLLWTHGISIATHSIEVSWPQLLGSLFPGLTAVVHNTSLSSKRNCEFSH